MNLGTFLCRHVLMSQVYAKSGTAIMEAVRRFQVVGHLSHQQCEDSIYTSYSAPTIAISN